MSKKKVIELNTSVNEEKKQKNVSYSYEELGAFWQSNSGKSSTIRLSVTKLANILSSLPDDSDSIFLSLVPVRNREPHQPTNRLFLISEV